MLCHVVLIKLTDPDRDADEIVAKLRGLLGVVPGILELTAGRNVVPSDRAYDVGLVARFADVDTMLAYRAHPAHQPVFTHITARATSIVSIDYPLTP
jgi:hypothetical protein